MTDLQMERERRGLPAYRKIVARRTHRRPEGRAGQLDTLRRGRLRTMIARMVTDRPGVTNREIADHFASATGVCLSHEAIRFHRARMALPSAPTGQPRSP